MMPECPECGSDQVVYCSECRVYYCTNLDCAKWAAEEHAHVEDYEE